MSMQFLINIVITLALVGFIASRQLRWRRIDRAGVWKMPAILGIVGLFSLSSTAKGMSIGPVDVTILSIELALSVAVGLLMGRITILRVAATADDKGRRIEARAGGVGAALWIVLIGVRVGLDVIGGLMGAHLLTATGVILLTVAVNRATSAATMDARLPRLDTVRV